MQIENCVQWELEMHEAVVGVVDGATRVKVVGHLVTVDVAATEARLIKEI